MAKFQVTTAKPEEVKKAPQLPKASVTASPHTEDGVEGLLVQTFYPFPEDTQLLVIERKGKKTAKVDNSDKIVSVLTTIGRASKVGLTMINEAGEEVALIDGNGNQLTHTSKVFTLVKGEGAEDEDEDDETA
jgi:hypothetical protein